MVLANNIPNKIILLILCLLAWTMMWKTMQGKRSAGAFAILMTCLGVEFYAMYIAMVWMNHSWVVK